jgi:thiol-disulfide isomerase/thioredoxin
MNYLRLLCLLVCCFVPSAAQEPSDEEQAHLRRVLGEAGSSRTDFLRAIETHLTKYPQSPRMLELVRGAFESAAQLKDQVRVRRYGMQLIALDSADIGLLDKVIPALLASETDRPSIEKGRELSLLMQKQVKEFSAESSSNSGMRVKFELERRRYLGRALTAEGRAAGLMGELPVAIAKTREAWSAWPAPDTSRELARWLMRAGRPGEAAAAYADTLAVADETVSSDERVALRKLLKDAAVRPTPALRAGDLLLEAYDRAEASAASTRTELRLIDPNFGRARILDFTLNGQGKEQLDLSSLSGKVVVMDFWATWCGPCRGQQPLYDQVKEQFSRNKDVVFLNINTDEDRSAVAPFLEKMKWRKTIWFDEGLSALLTINSIPMTLVLKRNGDIYSRMNGYQPDSFVEDLKRRIQGALEEKP